MDKPFLFSESELGDAHTLEEVSPTIKRGLEKHISGATDSSLSDIQTPSPVRKAKALQKSFTIEIKTHHNLQLGLQKKVIWAFILFFVVILERIFVAPFQHEENTMIIALQKALGITYNSHNVFIDFFLNMEEGIYFYLLLTHFFLVLFYYVNPVTCLKVMYVNLNALVCVLILEILLGEARPFWEDSNIVGVQCTDSYGFPNFSLFGVMFLFLYTKHCVKDNTLDDTANSRTRRIIIIVLFAFFATFLCISQVVGGITYLTQVIVIIIYSLFIYSLAVMFDNGITYLVEKSCIDIEAAKRHTIFWLIYLCVVGAISTFIYGSADPHVKITYLANYVKCMTNQNQVALVADDSSYRLLGPWGSYEKSVVIFMLLGAIFGTAKTFRDFKGTIWYAVEGKKKLKMAFFANICVIPSWVLLYIRYSVFGGLGEINIFLLDCLHLCILYFVLFGVLPKKIFGKLKWVKSESDYHYVPDYLDNQQEMAL